jgi:hypothetical protein
VRRHTVEDLHLLLICFRILPDAQYMRKIRSRRLYDALELSQRTH